MCEPRCVEVFSLPVLNVLNEVFIAVINMEKIYDPNSFRASEHIAIKEYFKQYANICNTKCDSNARLKYPDKMMQLYMGVNLNNKDFQLLKESCSIDKLTVPDEHLCVPAEIPEKLQTKTKLSDIYPINNHARQLNVVICKEILDKKYNINENFKFGGKRFLKMGTVVSGESTISDIMPGSTFIYSILVYRPYSISYGQRNSAEKLRFAYEIEALGTNTLAEVADAIDCLSNIGLYKEVENTGVDLAPLMNARDHYPSQTIFIDGVFYNDTRSPLAIDYSVKVIQWAHENNIGKFESQIMEETKLENLTPRLGYPYVYIHQGNCEHLITFSDARLIQSSDCRNSKKYPRIVSLSRVSNINCFTCGIKHSQWIVLNCDKFPQEKVFLCTGCCNSYLYVDGKKVTEFQLYPYYDQELMARHSNTSDFE